MEPVTALAGALIAGATAAVKDVASQAVKDSYQALKTKLSVYFQEKKCPEGEMALSKIENGSETWKKILEESLESTGAATKDEIKELCQRLIEAIKQSPETIQGLNQFNIKVESGATVGNIAHTIKIGTMNL